MMDQVVFIPRRLYENFQAFLFRPMVVMVCLALCLAFGYVVTHERFPLILAGVGGGLVALLSLYRLRWGIVLLVVVTLWVRIRFTTGTASPLVASLLLTLLLVVVWVVRLLLFEKRGRLVRSPATILLIALGVVAVCSYVWSHIFPDPRVVISGWWRGMANPQVASLMVTLASVGIALLFADQILEEKWFRIIVMLFVLAGVHSGVQTLLGTIGLNNPFQGIPVIGTLNTGGLFRTWAMAFCAGQFLFNRELNRRDRIILGVISALLFYEGFFRGTQWLVGWVPVLVVIGILFLLRSPKLLLVFLILALLFVLIEQETLSSILEAESEESGETRLAAWETNLSMLRGHWFLGTGPAGYAAYYMTYIPNEAMATHNNYLDVVSQYGLVGLSLIVWLFIVTGKIAIWTVRRAPRGDFMHALSASLLAGFVATVFAMFLGDWVLPFAYTQGIAGFDYTVWGWMFIGGVVAAEQIVKSRIQGNPAAASLATL